MTERYIVDDAGTLIDIETRNTYDYVSEICPILNKLNDGNKELKEGVEELNEICKYYEMRIKELDSENQHIKNLITEAYQNERTQLGRNVLKQLLDQME